MTTLNDMLNNVRLRFGKEDSLTWLTKPSGAFSVSSAYLALHNILRDIALLNMCWRRYGKTQGSIKD